MVNRFNQTSSPTLPPLRSTPLFLGRFSTFTTANVPYRHTRCFCNDIIGNAVKNFVSIPDKKNAIVSKPICQSLFLFQGVCFRSLNFFLFPASSCSFRNMKKSYSIIYRQFTSLYKNFGNINLSRFSCLNFGSCQAAFDFFFCDHFLFHSFQGFVIQIVNTDSFQSLLNSAVPKGGHLVLGSGVLEQVQPGIRSSLDLACGLVEIRKTDNNILIFSKNSLQESAIFYKEAA